MLNIQLKIQPKYLGFKSTICRVNGKSYRYGFNGKEKDNETYGEGNAYDFGARIYDSRLGRWLSLDPLMMCFASLSPYIYVANSPLFLVEVGGRWFVKFDNPENPTKLVFVAEEGDNLSTLEIQMGLKSGTLSNNDVLKGKTISLGTELSTELEMIDKVKNINGFLQTQNSINNNCAAAAATANGDGYTGQMPPEELTNDIINNYKNVNINQSSIGDIITYEMTEEEYINNGGAYDVYTRSEANYQTKYTTYEDFLASDDWKEEYKTVSSGSPDHFAVVLLKDKTGNNVTTIFEKSGQNNAAINTFDAKYPNTESGSSNIFEKKAINPSESSPIYTKKPK